MTQSVLSSANHEMTPNEKHAYFEDVEVFTGDPEYDGRVILYVIKGKPMITVRSLLSKALLI
jgi:hypothetical protein